MSNSEFELRILTIIQPEVGRCNVKVSRIQRYCRKDTERIGKLGNLYRELLEE